VRVDIDLAVRRERQPAHHVIGVVVRVDQRSNGLLRDLAELGFHLSSAFHRTHDIDDEHALIAIDHDRVGDAKSDRLIHAVGHLVYLPPELLAQAFERSAHLRVELDRSGLLRLLWLLTREEQARQR
jgi:hypothetical protein